jgi:DNA invertase Pin-like site-specific DNA recombinase
LRNVAIYTRVSTDHQTTENQERELGEIARRMRWRIVQVYRDEGVSGAKSRARTARPLMRCARTPPAAALTW